MHHRTGQSDGMPHLLTLSMKHESDARWRQALKDQLIRLQRQEERLHAKLEAYELIHRHWCRPAMLDWPPEAQSTDGQTSG